MTTKPPPNLDEAARHTLAGLHMMQPRLSHAYGCPSETGGPCTCGFAELQEGLAMLMEVLVPTAEPTKKH